MRIDPTLLNTVAFLCQEHEDENGVASVVPAATAFLVRIEENDLAWKYLVTARHNIELANDPIVVRVNNTDGKIEHIETRKEQWTSSYSADVSCFLFWEPTKTRPDVDHASIIVDQFIGKDFAYSGPPLTSASGPVKVGLGDSLAFVGLFSQHYGESKNVPIARFGNVSAMPGDQIRMTLGSADNPYSFDVVGYLSECKSWGGLSGSPVIWNGTTIGREIIADGIKGPEISFPLNGLLGLVSGHFDIEQKAKTRGDVLGEIFTAINSGIAVITPASEIRDLLCREDLAELRNQFIQG